MIIFERNVTPKIGKASTVVANLSAQMPAYRAAMGLPVSAYRAIGSGATGRVKIVILGESIDQLATAAARQSPEMEAAVEAMRAETNAAEDEQLKMVLVHHPPSNEDDANLAFGSIGVPRSDCITQAAENCVAIADHMMSLGARSAFVAWSISGGPFGELTVVSTFATPAQFDAWSAAWLANPRGQELVAEGAEFLHPAAMSRNELFQRIG